MGCTGSKTVAQEPGTVPQSLGKGIPEGPPATRPRLGRLSIAGDFKQYESMTHGAQSFDNDNGSGVLPPVTPGGPVLRYAYASQRGHYPDQPDKANQDAVLVRERLNGNPALHLFGVLDGHGETGAECAQFARAKIPLLLNADAALGVDPHGALHRALVATNDQLHRAPIDDSLSGTTACLALLEGTRLVVANVGDSRAVLARRPAPREDGGAPPPNSSSGLEAVELTTDQTPFREDECERVQAAGARVLTLDQMEGLKDRGVRCWTNEAECDGDPPRLWSPNGTYPGTAFTRSIGDSVAEAIGVFAEPELCQVELDRSHAFLIVASDGVFEFVGSQRAVDIIAGCADPAAAVATLTSISYKAWLARETRTDDISVAVIYFDFPPVAEETA